MNLVLQFETTHGQLKPAEVCGLTPGQSYLLTVVARKGAQSSEPVSSSFTLRPAPPSALTVRPAFAAGLYRLEARFPNASLAERCQLGVVAGDGQRLERTADVHAAEDGGRT